MNFLMFWGKMILLYGILRKLKIAPLFAFMTTLLFQVYPVNSGLMSLRSFPHTFSMLALLASVYLALDYRDKPSRLGLLGVSLALLLNVASYEIAYVIIFVVPILWWWQSGGWTWRKINLTLAWHLFPAGKIVYLLSLTFASKEFYGSNLVGDVATSSQLSIESVSHHLTILRDIYHHAFLVGWQEALSTLGGNTWVIANRWGTCRSLLGLQCI